MTTIKLGSRGEDVRKLQELLKGLTVDGVFGAKTDAAVRAFQIANGLKADGIVGIKTWTALGVVEQHRDNPRPANFKQFDSRWGKTMYSHTGNRNQTMASSGCGPTSAADIVATWWNTGETPRTLADKALTWGCRTANSGTTAEFFRKVHNRFGGNTKYRHAVTSMDSLIECLDQGGCAVANVGKSKWTSGGHYIVVYKYDGINFYINDPASSAANRAIGTYAELKAARKAFYLYWKEPTEE